MKITALEVVVDDTPLGSLFDELGTDGAACRRKVASGREERLCMLSDLW